MPSINYNMDETLVNIARPAVLEITDSLKRITGFDRDAKVVFPGDLGTVSQNSTIKENLVGNNKIIIDYNEESMPEYLSSTAIGYSEHPLIFSDKSIGFNIRPIYVKTKLTINYKLVSSSRNEIHKWVERMRVNLSTPHELNLHKITYHYTYPENVIKFIKLIHSYTEAKDPYNRNFSTYLIHNSPARLTAVSDTVGKTQIPAIKETQTRLLGQYDFSPLPDKPEKDNDTGEWSVTFTYIVTYEKPLALNIQYPVMVHNQLLPKVFTHIPQPPAVAYSSLSQYALEQFLTPEHFYQYVDKNGTLRLPVGDYFEPATKRKEFTPVFYFLVSLEEDRRTLINLTDLDEFVLDQDVLEFLKSEQPYMFREYNSIFQFFVYKNDNPISVSKTEITQDLTIRTKVDLSFRDIHRVEFSLVNDLNLLTKEALMRLKDNIGVFLKLLITMNDIQSTGNQRRFNYSYQYLLELFATRTGTDITRALKDFLTVRLNTHNDVLTSSTVVRRNGTITTTDLSNYTYNDLNHELYFSYRAKCLNSFSLNYTPDSYFHNPANNPNTNNRFFELTLNYDDYFKPEIKDVFGNNFTPVDKTNQLPTLQQYWLNRFGNSAYQNTSVDRYGYYYDNAGVKRHFLGEIANVYLDRLRYLHTFTKTVMVNTVVAIKREV